jgi:tRNA-dihydrouridine synthase B
LGYTRETVNVADISSLVARHADMLTIHGRTRSESYEHGVDLEGISKGVQAARAINPKVAVLSNGDVFAHSDAERHLTVTASDGVMVSRGALGNPWIFSSLRSGQEVFPSVCEWQEVVLRHIDYQREFFGDTPVAAVLMRKHLLWYSKGFAGSKKFREKLGQVSDLAEARAAIRDFALQIPADSRRFDGKRHLTDATEQQSSDPKWEMDRTYDRGVGTEGLEA